MKAASTYLNLQIFNKTTKNIQKSREMFINTSKRSTCMLMVATISQRMMQLVAEARKKEEGNVSSCRVEDAMQVLSNSQ